MRFEIRKEKNNEQVLEFYLRDDDCGGIILRALKKDTKEGCNILVIRSNGYLELYDSIPDDFGLKVDSNGYIIHRGNV